MENDDVITYWVQSPQTDMEKGKMTPPIQVVVRRLPDPIVTKTGAIGIAVRAWIGIGGGMNVDVTGLAVCHPLDKYDFRFGGKLALKRALKKAKLLKPDRANVWTGFHAYFKEAKK